MRPTKQQSDKRLDLPRIRECEDCRMQKAIVSHGRCDACRKKHERLELAVSRDITKKQPNKAKSMKLIAEMYKLFEGARVFGRFRRNSFANFLPFLGLAQDEQQAQLKILCPQETHADIPAQYLHEALYGDEELDEANVETQTLN